MIYILNILILLIFFPSISWGKIKIGVFPVKIEGYSEYLAEVVKDEILEKLSSFKEIQTVDIKKGNRASAQGLDYFLKSWIEIKENKAKIKFILFQKANSRIFCEIEKKVDSSELFLKINDLCEKIAKEVLVKEKILNSTVRDSIKGGSFKKLCKFFSHLFFKKREFDIKIPISLPPPPPEIINIK